MAYRTPDQMIADLEAKIASIKEREARKAARKDPTLREVNVAAKALERAVRTCGDAAMKGALEQVRTTLASSLGMPRPVAVTAAKSQLPRASSRPTPREK